MTKDEALKLALEEIKELVNQYVQIPKHHSSAKTLTILEQALAAPVQPGRNHYEDGDVFERIAAMNKPPAAQRQWVGLTHGEYIEAEKAIWDVVSMDDTEKKANREFYRAIEAKLKQKNAAAQPAVQSCYCPNCEAMGKELAALKAQPAPVQELQRYSPNGEGGMEVDSLGAYVKHKDVTTPPAQPAPVQKPVAIYQYQMADGSWIDQIKDSYDYNVRHGQATVRIVYTTPPAARGNT